MPLNPPVPQAYPFTQQPLRWASPPGSGEAGAVLSPVQSGIGGLPVGSLTNITFGVRGTGLYGTAWPNLVRVGTQRFNQPVGILGVSIAASIVNAAAAATSALIVHKDTGVGVSATSGTDFYVEYVVEQGLSHSIRTGTSFSDNLAPYFGSNESMAIYALMLNAACAFTAIVTIRYVVLP